jgi:hypothetical protein
MRPGQTAGNALQALPHAATKLFAAKQQDWLLGGLAEFLKAQGPRFITATEDAAEGVALRFTIERPPGLNAFCQAMSERGASGNALAQALSAAGRPTVRVDVSPGHGDCG